MSDPFSAASSVIGVVSFGLTVCEGLISYFSAYKGQAQYLDNLTKRAENLRGCLGLLQHALPSWMVHFSHTAPQIEQHMTVCDASIEILSNKLSSFKQKQGPSLRRDKLQHVAQKAAFPFKKATIDELSDILDGLQDNLNTVLSIVGLEASSMLVKTQTVTNTKIDAVLSASGVMTAHIQNAGHDISSLRAEMSIMRNDLQAMRSILGPGVHTAIQRSDSPTPTARLQTLPPPELEGGQVQSQHLPEPNSPTRPCRQVSSRRPTSSATNILEVSPSLICLCRKAKTRWSTRAKTLFLEYLQVQEHEEDCPYYALTSKKRRLDIWLTYRPLMISRGFRCMASLVTGSAGISPNIDWIPIVSTGSSAAMPLFNEMKRKLTGDEDLGPLLDGVHAELMSLFAQRKVHPREVNERGQSLLDHVSRLVSGHMWSQEAHKVYPSFARFLYSLASLGAKANHAGFSEDLLHWDQKLRPQLGALTEDLAQREALEGQSSLGNHLRELSRYRQWHHVFETGPLSRAILRREPEEMIRILQRKSSFVGDFNDWGHSLLHLSCDWPLGLVILLKYGASSLVDRTDSYGLTPNNLLKESYSEIGSMVLIAAGTRFTEGFLEIVTYRGMFRRPSQELSDVAIEGLSYRRKQLQRLATLHLPQGEHSVVADTVKLLDENAAAVSSALEKSGIRAPEALFVPGSQTTLYHGRELGVRTAQKLYDTGFCDFDGRDSRGYTPLMGENWGYHGAHSFTYARWLCDRDANLLCQFPPCTSSNCHEGDEHQRPIALQTIHSAAFRIGEALFRGRWNSLDWEKSEQATLFLKLLLTIASSDVSDGCSCACSSQGCTPVLNILDKSSPNGARSYWFLRWLDLHLPYAFPRIFLKVLRLCTFDALGLTHTCCRHGCRRDEDWFSGPWWKSCPFSTPVDEEIHEIQEEEKHLISLLDSLMAEFTEQWLWPTSEWGVDDFISKVWRPRLRQVQSERARMSVEEQAQMRGLGIKMRFDEEDSWNQNEGDDGRYAEDDPDQNLKLNWEEPDEAEDDAETAAMETERKERELEEIRAFFTDVEVAEILKEAARVNGLEDYDVWFRIIGKPDPRRE
ncbi:uncharacterized protein PV07_01412 [Cladophialophora immunda]|uniref:Fungal N-terminal domain-containing protein n=1 Tax=Cladophialophora immunda TaxID=569365 RepID=A0A0D2CXN3_9EURO|nr:uncharacterized protein PV07_01412 [Cladophialophora immunda]KIW34645.1 hypothetical protein PV07_01412 [Cladophialophora immunda]